MDTWEQIRADGTASLFVLCAVQIKMHGGRVDSKLSAGTTHVVLVPGAAEEWAPSAGQLLEVLWREQGGVPALSTLRRGLMAGSVRIVRSRRVPGAKQACVSSSC